MPCHETVNPRTQLSARSAQSTLERMKWRRGLLLAGINVAAALPMIAILASRDAQWLRDREQNSRTSETSPIASLPEFSAPQSKEARSDEEQTVSFNPCGLWGHISTQVSVVQWGNLPSFVLTQWRVACPPRWSLASRLGVGNDGLLSDHNVRAMRRVDVALCVCIAVQWFLIGSFPLIKARRWWSEPGAFITLCASIGSGIALIPAVEGLGRLPAIFAFFAWLWYFALLLRKPVQLAWQSTLPGLRRLS